MHPMFVKLFIDTGDDDDLVAEEEARRRAARRSPRARPAMVRAVPRDRNCRPLR
jgi:hypothetical protein